MAVSTLASIMKQIYSWDFSKRKRKRAFYRAEKRGDKSLEVDRSTGWYMPDNHNPFLALIQKEEKFPGISYPVPSSQEKE